MKTEIVVSWKGDAKVETVTVEHEGKFDLQRAMLAKGIGKSMVRAIRPSAPSEKALQSLALQFNRTRA